MTDDLARRLSAAAATMDDAPLDPTALRARAGRRRRTRDAVAVTAAGLIVVAASGMLTQRPDAVVARPAGLPSASLPALAGEPSPGASSALTPGTTWRLARTDRAPTVFRPSDRIRLLVAPDPSSRLAWYSGAHTTNSSDAARIDDGRLIVDAGGTTTEGVIDPAVAASGAWFDGFVTGRPRVALQGDELTLTSADASLTFQRDPAVSPSSSVATPSHSAAPSTTTRTGDVPVADQPGPRVTGRLGLLWTLLDASGNPLPQGENVGLAMDPADGNATIWSATHAPFELTTPCGRTTADSVAVVGGRLVLGRPSPSQACTGAASEQRQRVLAVLTSRPRVSWRGDWLLVVSDGSTELVFRGYGRA